MQTQETKRVGGVPLHFTAAGLTQVSDIQLWLANLPWDSSTITAPVYVAKCSGALNGHSYVMWPALRIPEPLYRSLVKHFSKLGVFVADRRWIARDDQFPCGMTKADGVTPSYYLDPAILAGGAPAEPQDFSNDFMREVYEASGIADFAIFSAVWAALISSMPRWLMRSLKPIDLQYFKIHAIPLRYNWKLNLLAAFPSLRTVIAHVGRKKWKMIIPQLRDAMFNTKQVELHEGDKHPYFGWTLEVVPTKQFTDFATAVETTRSQAYPGEAYIRQWGAIIARLQPQLEEILFYACKKTSYASASVRQHGQDGPPGFRPLLAPGTMRNEAVDRDDLPIVCNPPGTFVTSEESGEPIEVKSFKHMPTVSFVRRKR